MENLDSYRKELLIIDLTKANIQSLLLIIPIILVFGLPYHFIWGVDFEFIASILMGWIWILIFILGIITHELIHGISWSLFTKKGFQSIKFGILWKMLTPYCHCKEPLMVKHYMIGAIMPAIILGFIPAIIAIATGQLGLLLFGMIFILSAAGDFMIINLIRKEKMTDLVQDHPSEAGCFIYRE